jgi:hypothetical protein
MCLLPIIAVGSCPVAAENKNAAESHHRFGGTPAALLVEPYTGLVVANGITRVVPTAVATTSES